MRILISCGEASGEHYAAALARELRTRRPDVELVGVGGDELAAAGVELWARREELAVMGFAEVLRHLPRLRRLRQRLIERARAARPALFLPVDYPGFHISLAGALRREGIPVLDFIPPKTWSWGSWRLRGLRRAVDRCAVIFPFEQDYYRSHGIDAQFVGHPLVERPAPEPLPQRAGLLLVPGSRAQELQRIAPTLAELVRALRRERPQLELRVSRAPGVAREWLRPLLDADPALQLCEEPLWQLLHGARVAVVTSGTATLEAALAATPHLIVYRTSGLSYAIARRLATVDHIGMANIVLGGRAFPEFLQADLRAPELLAALRPLLDDEAARAEQLADCRALREALGQPGAIGRVAELALSLLDR